MQLGKFLALLARGRFGRQDWEYHTSQILLNFQTGDVAQTFLRFPQKNTIQSSKLKIREILKQYNHLREAGHKGLSFCEGIDNKPSLI